MNKIIKVVFKKNGKIYYFSSNNLDLTKDMEVIVETEKGTQFGYTVSDVIEDSTTNRKSPLKNILRVATKDDVITHEKNIADAEKAFSKCNDLIKKYNLDMYLLDAEYTFDRSQLFFRFLADVRVDFRDLAKSLASIYHTRIELRQIGVRDKAKLVGGIGVCGRELCCKKFLDNFDTVSINMAKNQNLSLNPTKINGCCGRLLCCLNYEDEQYREYKKNLPSYGSKVKTDKGYGKVINVDVYGQTYDVLCEDEVIRVKVEEKVK